MEGLRTYSLEIEFTEDLLGSVARNEEVYKDYIKTKAPQETVTADEMVEGIEEKGWTGFYIDNQGRPCIMDYQIKGFLKEAGNTVKDFVDGGNLFKALRSHIDNEVFVFPRRVPLADKVAGVLERPLRAMTAQGPRVTVVRSDFIEAGTTVIFQLKVLPNSKITEPMLRTILDYGELKGLGQWRNGSYGRFTYKLEAMA